MDDEVVIAESDERDFRQDMARVYVFRKGEQIYFYDSYYVPNKGDRVYTLGFGTLRVKYKVFFADNPDIAEIHVK